MAVVLTKIEQDINECIRKREGNRCAIFDPDHQPSVRRQLDKGWDPIVWWIYNGMSLDVGHGIGPLQLSSRVVCCVEHEDALIERGGWNGTGDRQNKEM